ncbi:chemotaxis protein CheW [Caulobacter sp. D4A]|jgi:purine-binding chemotaxis protein CheW|uniref:chemotaxis protein CheW n=1 Tax=unclassified Caulobacter TaxID=2648921 RepID=UPI000D7399A8|nr:MULTISPECIES: chemotaxis protein CheW [unclassified Caulobacter]PXA91298.1 chemotaxis protein CheW [Caulobacter sp. D4A]PXA93293.1 chemotaxis protein CheW [Caulobacter sp. D5]
MTEEIITTGERRELISFRVGDQEYCVDIMAVREIRGWSPATTLPQSPGYMRGVINLRGAVLPIMDLACRLGMPMVEPTVRSVFIVVKAGDRMIGMLVDAVSDILSITDDLVQPTPDLACDMVRNFIRGIISIDGRMISEISLDRLLPEREALAA